MRIAFSVFFLMICCSVSGQNFLRVKDKQIVDGDGKNILLRGMGLGGWMLQEGYMLRVEGIGQQQHVFKAAITELVGQEKTSLFYDKWLKNHCTKTDIDSLASWGFNSVRLPMHYNLYTLPVEDEKNADENTWLEKGFTMTDSLLKWCAANKMYLILDLHAAPGGQGNDLNISDRDPSKPSLWESEANRAKMIAFWRKIAERYVNEPWIGAYDIINEPNWGFENKDDKNGCAEEKNAPLRQLMVDITAAIREVDKNHIIIIEGNCWGNNYNGILPLWDRNTVMSFHKYWNYNDSNSIKKFIDLRNEHNVPIWLGESGENSNLWFRDAISLMERNNIGWAWWPLKKIGFNNPLEVRMPEEYQQILKYWKKEGPKPSPEDAWGGLLQLTENIRIENCIFHKDVIDAMFRQTHSDTVVPFKPNKIKDDLTIAAVDFDLGRNRYAYFDKDTGNYWVSTQQRTPGNTGRMYRNDGVDISGEEDNYYVSNIEADEWLQYTFQSEKNDNGVIKVIYSADDKQGVLEVTTNGKKSSELSLKPTGAETNWKNVEIKAKIVKGENVLRLKALQGGFNLKAIAISL